MRECSFAERWEKHVAGHVGLGCWALGGKGWGGQSEREARAVLAEAWEAGYRHFDTASSYGYSERVLGAFLQETGGTPFIASKVYPGPNSSRIRESVCRSLERLRRSHLDLYYLHWPRGEAIEGDVEALAACVDEGLVGKLGVSNYSVDQLRRAHRITPVAVYQGPYNLLWRVADDTIIPVCRELGIAFVGYGALAEGLLARMELPQSFPIGDHRAHSRLFCEDDREAVTEVLGHLRAAIRGGRGGGGPQVLRWALDRPGVSAVLAGARRPGQAKENKLAELTPLHPDTVRKLDQVSESARSLGKGLAHYFGTHA